MAKKKGWTSGQWALALILIPAGFGVLRVIGNLLAMAKFKRANNLVNTLKNLPKEKWDESEELEKLAKVLGTTKAEAKDRAENWNLMLMMSQSR